jgi:hypothetical protein
MNQKFNKRKNNLEFIINRKRPSVLTLALTLADMYKKISKIILEKIFKIGSGSLDRQLLDRHPLDRQAT